MCYNSVDMKKFIAWGKGVIRGFSENHCAMHAAGLTYFSLLAIVPILCVLLLTAKSLGADRFVREQINGQIDAMITNIESGQDDNLAALTTVDDSAREQKRMMAQEFGAKARELSNQVFERVEQFDVGTLGWIGFLTLLWTVISSIGMVEVSFNELWGVEKSRPIWKRAYLYLFVALAVPALAALAASVPILNLVKNTVVATAGSTAYTKWLSDGLVWFLESTLLRLAITFVFASLTFGFLYWVMPNCKVGFRHAFYGGMMTSFFFGAWVKLCAVAQVGIAKSSALYGSLAFLPIILAWLYMSWQIILLGAAVVRSFELMAGDSEKIPVS